MIHAAVLGSPIAHSLSPALHRAAYQHLGIQGKYEAIEVAASALAEFIYTRDETWTGFSLTMPLKEEVLEIADHVDPLALQINSANTLIRSESGWDASTTDVSGFKNALLANGITQYEEIVIIGAGATARAAAAACDQLGKRITVLSRSAKREAAMREAVRKSRVSFIAWNEKVPAADLTVNTTPAGVADIFVDQILSQPVGVFFEALYHPWPTKLLARWKALGGQSIDGLDLLVQQAIDQVSLMCNVEINRDEIAPILRAAGLTALES